MKERKEQEQNIISNPKDILVSLKHSERVSGQYND